MKPIFTELFVNKLRHCGAHSRIPIQEAVNGILEKPGSDPEHYYPWEGCFERAAGPYRVVYGICGECRRRGLGSQHAECSGYADETIVFRTIYVVL